MAGVVERASEADRGSLSARSAWVVIGVGLGVHMLGLALVDSVFAGLTWENHPLHSAMETAGGLMALWVAWTLMTLQQRSSGTSHNVWIAGGFVAMGSLYGMHAVFEAGEVFVWFHSIATFLGGALFLWVWAPRAWQDRVQDWWVPAVGGIVLILTLITVLAPWANPRMLVVSAGGAVEFSMTAKVLNVLGGVFLLASVLRLFLDYRRWGNADDLLFCLPLLLFGWAAMMFEQSHLWDFSWWLWHLLRLLAFGVILIYVVRLARRDLRRLATYATQVEHRNQELRDFAHAASHDLRAPLRACENIAHWIQDDNAETLKPESHEQLSRLRQRVARMDRLLDSLRDFAQIDHHNEEPIWLNLNTLLREIMAEQKRPESFQVKLPGELPDILAPRKALKEILGHLIDNAARHHDREDGRVSVTWRKAGDTQEFVVADDGPGIPAEFHERIFGIFETLRPRDQVEGAGMGLALVRKTAEHLGGRVSLSSVPGQGASFTLTLPTTKPNE